MFTNEQLVYRSFFFQMISTIRQIIPVHLSSMKPIFSHRSLLVKILGKNENTIDSVELQVDILFVCLVTTDRTGTRVFPRLSRLMFNRLTFTLHLCIKHFDSQLSFTSVRMIAEGVFDSLAFYSS